MARQFRIFIDCPRYSGWRIIDNLTFTKTTLPQVSHLKKSFSTMTFLNLMKKLILYH